MSLILNPEQHPRLGSSYSIPTEIAVGLDDERGDASGYMVELSIESEWGERIYGPPRPEPGVPAGARVGDTLYRQLNPDEARALAAALWHYADAADRRRRP